MAVNLTFTSPLLPGDWELMSRPAHYVTFDVAALDHTSHAVNVYFDVTANIVARDLFAPVTWDRHPLPAADAEALSLGGSPQYPIQVPPAPAALASRCVHTVLSRRSRSTGNPHLALRCDSFVNL